MKICLIGGHDSCSSIGRGTQPAQGMRRRGHDCPITVDDTRRERAVMLSHPAESDGLQASFGETGLAL